MRTNPVNARVLKDAVKDGYGRTTLELVSLLPEWLKEKIQGKEEEFLENHILTVSLVDGLWYAKGKEPMRDWTR